MSYIVIYHLIFRFSLFLHNIFAIFFMLIRLQINIMITYDLHLRYLFRHQICFMARMQKCELKQGYRNVMCAEQQCDFGKPCQVRAVLLVAQNECI